MIENSPPNETASPVPPAWSVFLIIILGMTGVVANMLCVLWNAKKNLPQSRTVIVIKYNDSVKGSGMVIDTATVHYLRQIPVSKKPYPNLKDKHKTENGVSNFRPGFRRVAAGPVQ